MVLHPPFGFSTPPWVGVGGEGRTQVNSAVEVGMNFERCLERTKDERHTVHGSDEWGGRSMQSDR